MPELPEVETTRRGIAPYVEGQTIHRLAIRDARLRWPIPDDLPTRLQNRTVARLLRRGKYLLMDFAPGFAVMHLGMSGSLRIVGPGVPPEKHDHYDLVLASGQCVRYRDPRRFGCLLWTAAMNTHPLLRDLGPEPLSPAFDGAYLRSRAAERDVAVKNFIMDSRVVVGVGNIYASESLFLAGIHPNRAAGRVSAARFDRLAECIRSVLHAAIDEGGTTLRDFVNESGRPGYFRAQLHVYGRDGQPCTHCGRTLKLERIGQRATVYCTNCQH